MTKVLLTGGGGFIGSHLADYFINHGIEVAVIDNFSTGKLSNIKKHMNNPLFTLYVENILNYSKLDELCNSSDVIFHLASSVGVSYIYGHPLESLESNIEGNIRVLKLAAKFHKPLVFFSSSEIYGKNNEKFLDEQSDRVLGPSFRWSYSVGKAIGEYYAQALKKKTGSQFLVIRCFNIVGPRQTGKYGMVLPRFIMQARNNEPITVYGTGEQIRTFTSVYDLVEILWKLVFEMKDFGNIYNIGSQNTTSILELAKLVKSYMNSKSEITTIPFSEVYGTDFEDISVRVPSIIHLLQRLPQLQFRSLEDIIQSILEYDNCLEIVNDK